MMICAQSFSFRYRKDESWTLNDLTFEVSSGETVAIVGASGCGKSTLLRLLAGVLPSSIDNESIGKLKIESDAPQTYRLKKRIAFIFQEPTLLPHLTVEENVTFPFDFVPGGETLRPRVPSILTEVGVYRYRNSYPSILSGGTKARVALAQSFALEPSLLLLDEPFSSLDVGWKHQLYLQLEHLKRRTCPSIFLVTHDLDEAVKLADRLFVLGVDGSLLKDYSLKSIHNSEPLQVSNIINDILINHPASQQ